MPVNTICADARFADADRLAHEALFPDVPPALPEPAHADTAAIPRAPRTISIFRGHADAVNILTIRTNLHGLDAATYATVPRPPESGQGTGGNPLAG